VAQRAVSTTRAVKAEPTKQTVRVQKYRAPTLSKEMQKSMVEDELATVVVFAAQHAKVIRQVQFQPAPVLVTTHAMVVIVHAPVQPTAWQ
jgi:uncharacterized radical SAM superfamily Fe-S cluster-containing enzyme